ncbi:magnesium transporter [Yoonia sp.]|uniref:magnesium transporter n=1 Tax=Yoonia sp. TaxID=2212373 RepID=UPI00391BF412
MAEHDDDHEDEAFGITDRLVVEVREAVENADAAAVDALLDPLHPADIAHLIEQIDRKERRDLLTLWKGGIDGDILSELDENLREEIIGQLAPDELADALRDLDSDDVVDLVEYLDQDQQGVVLDALDASDRIVVEQALSYPEESAGRHMQSELVRAPEHWNVGEAIDFLRSDVVLPDQFYHIILVDPRLKATGYVTLGRILSHPRATPLRDLTEETFRTFHVTQGVEEVAQAINHYHLITAPVVDDDDRVVGVITIDDAMAFLEEEAEEDLLRLAGVGEGSLSDKVFTTSKQRLPWLAVNLVTANFAAFVISLFEESIAGLVALAVLMPIVASMGGNAGTQSLTVAVRALATRDLTPANQWRVVRREGLVGLINGVVFALVMAVIGYLWFGSMMLGVVIGMAMLINMILAGLAGTLVPVFLERFGFDPALASGTFVTTTTDVMGFFAFLGLATLILL